MLHHSTGYASELPFDAVLGTQARAIVGSGAGECTSGLQMLHLRRASTHALDEEYARVSDAGFGQGRERSTI